MWVRPKNVVRSFQHTRDFLYFYIGLKVSAWNVHAYIFSYIQMCRDLCTAILYPALDYQYIHDIFHNPSLFSLNVVNPIIKHLPLGLIIGYTTIWDEKLPQNGWLMGWFSQHLHHSGLEKSTFFP